MVDKIKFILNFLPTLWLFLTSSVWNIIIFIICILSLFYIFNSCYSIYHQDKIKVTKVKINRILEDATPWLEDKIEQDELEMNKIKQNFNLRGVFNSGMHIVEQIKRVNSLIKSINDYVKEMDRKIEDLLISVGKEKFKNVPLLKEEYQKYSEFINASGTAKNSIKEKNNGLCTKILDKSTFDAILKENPYRD